MPCDVRMFVQHVECRAALSGLVQFDRVVEGTDRLRIYRPRLQAAQKCQGGPRPLKRKAGAGREEERTVRTRLRRSTRESQDTTSKRMSPPRVPRDISIWSLADEWEEHMARTWSGLNSRYIPHTLLGVQCVTSTLSRSVDGAPARSCADRTP